MKSVAQQRTQQQSKTHACAQRSDQSACGCACVARSERKVSEWNRRSEHISGDKTLQNHAPRREQTHRRKEHNKRNKTGVLHGSMQCSRGRQQTTHQSTHHCDRKIPSKHAHSTHRQQSRARWARGRQKECRETPLQLKLSQYNTFEGIHTKIRARHSWTVSGFWLAPQETTSTTRQN